MAKNKCLFCNHVGPFRLANDISTIESRNLLYATEIQKDQENQTTETSNQNQSKEVISSSSIKKKRERLKQKSAIEDQFCKDHFGIDDTN